ncbi:MAG: DUF1905 domain-containing protein [Chitinophagales bacterium]|nr:DUF1905 domain-containing protein [Chitinophagales bacterium]
MLSFKTTIQKFDSKGEKTGWTYIEIEEAIAQQLKPGNKQSFRVKGKLDSLAIKQVALIPIGEGNFIMPLNADMRKKLGKRKGAELTVQLMLDETPFQFSEDMMACLEDEPKAMEAFKKLSGSEQKYFSKWIESAKTEPTKAKRITQTVNAMLKGYRYGEMIRALKKEG